jgi:regulatory protein
MAKDIFDKAKTYAYRLLGFTARSEKELKQKISDKGYNQKIANRVIRELKREGLVDDKKFAILWIKTRLEHNPRSLSAIKHELLSRGVDRDTAEGLLDGFKSSFDEEEAVKNLLKGRMYAVKGLDRQKAKQRLYGFLKRRGFANQIILKTLSNVFDETCRDS